MNNHQLQTLVEQLSLQYFNRPFEHQATFNNRLRTRGGDVSFKVLFGKVVRESIAMHINPKLLNLPDSQEQLRGVIKHELAHYHLLLTKGKHNENDKDFRKLLRQLEAPKYSPIQRKPPKNMYVYQCVGSMHHQITTSRRVNTNRYVCKLCHARLELVLEHHTT